MQSEPWGLHWFRRDLRIAGNEALRENWKRNKARTLGIFCFDSKFLSRDDFSHHRFAFFIKTLEALKADLQARGGDLLVVDCLPHLALPQIFQFCRNKKLPLPQLVSWGRDYEPFARTRDEKIEALLKKEGIEFFHQRDHLVFESSEIQKPDPSGGYYQVYSPFARQWLKLLAHPDGQARIESQKAARPFFESRNRDQHFFKLTWEDLTKTSGFPFADALATFKEQNWRNVTIPIPEAGFFEAYGQVLKFKNTMHDYKSLRDIPSVEGTSRLSIYFKNGSLTTAQVIEALGLKSQAWGQDSGPNQFLKEIIWREFYYSILFHRPEVEHKSFNPKYENLNWENDEKLFDRWKEGATGFPIVDAGMRQLKETGWMHNRVRMIVASFLTKDLLIDWKLGENHFMKELLDGDMAPNNGGWQWAASTGCDPQPYFRVFNPWLQGKKFDPDGKYIKTFVPELKAAPAGILHDPEADRRPWKYPKPIVNHSLQREKAIRLYKII